MPSLPIELRTFPRAPLAVAGACVLPAAACLLLPGVPILGRLSLGGLLILAGAAAAAWAWRGRSLLRIDEREIFHREGSRTVRIPRLEARSVRILRTPMPLRSSTEYLLVAESSRVTRRTH